MVILVSTLERGAVQSRLLFPGVAPPPPSSLSPHEHSLQLSTFVHSGVGVQWMTTYFENGVSLFKQYMTLNLIVGDAVYFSFQKGSRTCDESCVLNYSSTFA